MTLVADPPIFSTTMHDAAVSSPRESPRSLKRQYSKSPSPPAKRTRISSEEKITSHDTVSRTATPGQEAGDVSSEKKIQATNGDVNNNQSAVSENATQSATAKSTASVSERQSSHAPSSHAATATSEPRKPTDPITSRLEERKRNQRLFGGLVGTLSGKARTTAANVRLSEIESAKDRVWLEKRREIESRAREKAKEIGMREREGAVERRRVVKEVGDGDGEGGRMRDEERRERMERFSSAALLRMKHRNMRSNANHLLTSATPNLYYKPFQLLPSQTTSIASQISEAERTIYLETSRDERTSNSETELIRTKRIFHETDDSNEKNINSNATSHGETNIDNPQNGDDDNDKVETGHEKNGNSEKSGSGETASYDANKDEANEQENNEEDMVEGEEDTVIY